MKYNNITKRTNNLKLKHDLCELYIVCECMEEFIIKANLTYGKIPWRLLIAFRLFCIRKSKPLLYYSVKFSYYILLVGCIFTCFPLLLLLPISEIIFCYIYGDIMYTIKWYEDGCLRDY